MNNNGFKKRIRDGEEEPMGHQLQDHDEGIQRYGDRGTVLWVPEGEHEFRDNEGVEREGG